MTSYEKRLANARKWCKKISSMIDRGCYVFDDCGKRVFSYTDDGNTIGYSYSDGGCKIVHFWCDQNADNGALTPIKEYNHVFNKWTYINPADIRRLRR